MEEINKAYTTFQERDRIASLGVAQKNRKATRKRQDDCPRTYRDVARQRNICRIG